MEAILQNWRGSLFKRILPKQINHLPTRINRVIRTEIGKILPGRRKKK